MAAPWNIINALTAKLERAEEHIFDLQNRWDTFVNEGSYPVESKDDPNTGERTYYLGSVAPIPADIPLIAGDAVHNIRSTLDHLAHHLATIGRGKPGPFDDVWFPIRESATKYQTSGAREVKAFRDDAIKAIDAVEPYGGGQREMLWHLHRLDITDKHRLLLTVGSQSRFHSMSPAEIAKIRYQFTKVLEGITEANDPRMFLKSSAVVTFPLETGSILAILPKLEVQENMHFPIQVAFGEPDAIMGDPVVVTLKSMAYTIRAMIMEFDRLGLLE